MKIDRTTGPVPIQSTPNATARPSSGRREGEEPNSAPVPRRDRVEISAAARELAASLEPARAERVAEVQQRISDGTYDRPEVRSAVASRILASGDL